MRHARADCDGTPMLRSHTAFPFAMMVPQFIRYAGAGAFGTAAQYVILVALVQTGTTGAVVATTAGAIVGAAINYALNHRVTFASGVPHTRALPRFAAIATIGIALNSLVVAIMLALIGPHYLVAQIVATLAVLAAGYLANRAWTF
jgi:putative flippase GtrA